MIEVVIGGGSGVCYRCRRQIRKGEKAYKKVRTWKNVSRCRVSYLCVKCYDEVAIG